jgi:hypothetical protein
VTHLRRRDVRAIAFCVTTIAAVLVAALIMLKLVPAVAVAGGYTVFILTRPRMIRVIRRLRGDTGWDWSGYYRE